MDVHGNLTHNGNSRGIWTLQERQEAQKLLEDILGVATWSARFSIPSLT